MAECLARRVGEFTLKLDLTFVDNNKMPSITAEILAINFADGYTIDLTPDSKFIATGTALFDLINKRVKAYKLSIPDNEKVLYEKLQTVDISSFTYNVDEKNRNVVVTNENAAIISELSIVLMLIRLQFMPYQLAPIDRQDTM